MTRKKIIIILLALSLFITLLLAIIRPAELGELMDEGFYVYLIIFYAVATTLLCWIGPPTCWRFAVDNGFSVLIILLFAIIGLYISVPMAIFQLLTSNNN